MIIGSLMRFAHVFIQTVSMMVKKSVTEKPVRTITDEQLMEVIGEVKGVGPALRGKIKEVIEAKFGSIGNGKKAEEQKGTAC